MPDPHGDNVARESSYHGIAIEGTLAQLHLHDR